MFEQKDAKDTKQGAHCASAGTHAGQRTLLASNHGLRVLRALLFKTVYSHPHVPALSFYRALALIAWSSAAATAGETRQSFDVDPGWDASNNRPSNQPLTVKQDFGYSPLPGRIGGTVSPAGEPAFYAAKVGPFTLRDRLSASGVVTVKPGPGNVLLGFFNAGTINEWRTPNSLVWRLNDRGEVFHVHFEYATSKWRAGAGVIGRYDRERDRMHPIELPSGDTAYPWSLSYDPDGRQRGRHDHSRFRRPSNRCVS